MKIVRRVTYESDDEAELRRWMELSAPIGLVLIPHTAGGGLLLVEHLEGPQWPEDSRRWGGPRPEPYKEC